jgi:hypothetical protein
MFWEGIYPPKRKDFFANFYDNRRGTGCNYRRWILYKIVLFIICSIRLIGKLEWVLLFLKLLINTVSLSNKSDMTQLTPEWWEQFKNRIENCREIKIETPDTHVQQLTIMDCYINTRKTCTTAYYRGLLHKHQTHMYNSLLSWIAK